VLKSVSVSPADLIFALPPPISMLIMIMEARQKRERILDVSVVDDFPFLTFYVSGSVSITRNSTNSVCNLAISTPIRVTDSIRPGQISLLVASLPLRFHHNTVWEFPTSSTTVNLRCPYPVNRCKRFQCQAVSSQGRFFHFRDQREPAFRSRQTGQE